MNGLVLLLAICLALLIFPIASMLYMAACLLSSVFSLLGSNNKSLQLTFIHIQICISRSNK